MEPSLEHDLYSTVWIIDKIKSSNVYSQNLYAALCNNDFYKEDKFWACSWRYSGRIISTIREVGDYMDWYCSGIGRTVPGEEYVEEGFVTAEIKEDLAKLGWLIK